MKGSKVRSLASDLVIVLVTFTALGLMAFPFIWVVLTSVKTDAEIFSDTLQIIPQSVSLDNYTVLFQDTNFGTYIRNSIITCVSATFVSVIVALVAAYGFSRYRFRGRNLLLISVIATQLFPFVILISPIYGIFFRVGLVNSYAGLIISYVAITIPFSIFLLLGYLDTIPRDLDEAAVIDGASPVAVLFRILLPVAWPGVVVVAIYGFVQAWDEFLFALVLMTQEDRKTVPVGLASFFGEYTSQWNLVMAASVVATLPTLILFLFLQRRLVSDLTAGAVKQ